MQDKVSTLDCCANCGVAAVDEIKLKQCPHCDLVQYCSDKCRQDHREFHKERCIERAAELHDEILFKQPESSHLGDCPICFLPMPLDNQITYQYCCGQLLCNGCAYANIVSALEQGRERKCPFCREIVNSATDEEDMKRLLRRAEANDPLSLQLIGRKHYEEEDYENAFRYYTRAAEIGDVNAIFKIGLMYIEGKIVEKDMAKHIGNFEQAAICGHVGARYALGQYEWYVKRFDRAVKHYIISASLGHNRSIKSLTECYKKGHVSKDDFAKALRAYQAAADAMKSKLREAAAESRRACFEELMNRS